MVLDESPITSEQLNTLFGNQALKNLKILCVRNVKDLRNREMVGPLNDFRNNFYMRKEYMILEVLDVTGCKWYDYNLRYSRRFFETTILIGVLKYDRKDKKEEESEEEQPPQLLEPSTVLHDPTNFIPILRIKPSPLNI